MLPTQVLSRTGSLACQRAASSRVCRTSQAQEKQHATPSVARAGLGRAGCIKETTAWKQQANNTSAAALLRACITEPPIRVERASIGWAHQMEHTAQLQCHKREPLLAAARLDTNGSETTRHAPGPAPLLCTRNRGFSKASHTALGCHANCALHHLQLVRAALASHQALCGRPVWRLPTDHDPPFSQADSRDETRQMNIKACLLLVF